MADANQRTMRAARFDTAARSLTVMDVPVPRPQPGEVRVRVKACGICLSDAHLLDGSLQSPLPVVTPGHESSGVIDEVGPGVSRWQVGQRVALAGGKPCGRCVKCTNGQPSECIDFHIMGFHYDGAWAEYVVVPAFVLSAIPDHLPFEQAAILADAVATPYAGLVDTAQLRPAQSVGLWGIGGLGVHAVQIARMMGATPILAFDTNEAARQRALEFGADVALDPRAPDVREQILRHTGGMGLDVAVDLVGANVVLAQAAKSIGRHGRAVMVGLSPEPIQLGSGVNFGVRSQALLGHLGYEKKHLDQLVSLVGTKRLDVSRSVTATLSLEDVAQGVERLVKKEGNPIRLVITP
ncbi:alcohol dehydrogenase [Myxococcus stipitatus DSM 14675]|uniref:Alcohol dehydrogenase n=1 Tax=Myxococcus stipitatus (strain DSM 14675 / JCM 12634 / Mx s8) TaxID=1278073 RepID=L7U6A6_MYXSD|nr:zinc-binding dehydrogenase [Myxococcus stipitatus]AGC41979.1 alcohol dehydrogenase [Myxococcus stipitatus DSM 14675]